MTASGPFAMGPAMSGGSSRRSTPRSNFVPSIPSENPSSIGGNLSKTAPPSLRKDHGDSTTNGIKEEEEVYSDPDEGVEIIDMENVRQMDWMAPESLRKERQHAKKVKKEEGIDQSGKYSDVHTHACLTWSVAAAEVPNPNTLALEESEEEELEDIIEDFAVQSTNESVIFFLSVPLLC